MRGGSHPDIATRPTDVLDDENLTGRFLKSGGDHAADQIGRAARRVGHHDLYRAVRIGGIGRTDMQERGRGKPCRHRGGMIDNPAS